MDFEKQRNASLGCLMVLLIVLLGVTYLATSSLNPFTVFESGGALQKVVVSILAILAGMVTLQLLASSLIRWFVGLAAGDEADNVICPGCGNPLLRFISSHGQPTMCGQCRRLVHSGRACQTQHAAFHRSEASRLGTLFGDEDDLR